MVSKKQKVFCVQKSDWCFRRREINIGCKRQIVEREDNQMMLDIKNEEK